MNLITEEGTIMNQRAMPTYTAQIQMPAYYSKLKRAKELNIQYKNVFAQIFPRSVLLACGTINLFDIGTPFTHNVQRSHEIGVCFFF